MTSGREALEGIGAGVRFGLILCDLLMPDLTGEQFWEQLRRIDPSQADPRSGTGPASAMGVSEERKTNRGPPSPLAGMLWFCGWLFTIAYSQLLWWQGILALVVWPYYLGVAIR